MTHAPAHRPKPDTDQLRALAARCGLWLVAFVAWLADLAGAGPIGRALRAEAREDLLRYRRGLAGILVLLALERLWTQPRAPHAHRPGNAPRGWRRARLQEPMRGVTRRLTSSRTLRGRIAAFRRILDDLDAAVAHIAAHIARLPDAAYVMICAQADACIAVAAVAPRAADTS